MHFTETIYDIIECRKEIPKRRIRYKNRLDNKYLDELKSDKKPCATMGLAEYFPPDPSNFLRKHAKSNSIKNQYQVFEKKCLKHNKLPPLPRVHNEVTHKQVNFIKKNIQSIKKVKPKECEQKLVITRYGDTVNGKKLEPKHIYSKRFGTVPNYILDAVNLNFKEAEKKKDLEDIKTKIPGCQYVTRVEREKILNGLKENWYELSKNFQLLPIITDTIPKRLKKIDFENKLERIEKDILLMEKCPHIYVKG